MLKEYFAKGGKVSVYSPYGILLGHRRVLNGPLIPVKSPPDPTPPLIHGKIRTTLKKSLDIPTRND
jgi:hypothetical protein